ncbi:tetratricopeptide repeat protein [Telmatospirillum sp. J64-1]|uniref:tetratricopeptide repeat protein n=1 Tax=Telmatospirillum sp. J64-1 TaxID=2502183 RepID=UPI00115DC13D|nr:tetratricopeptide repeat protein [Telmatospirillum sp. J64-1]
MQHDKFDLPLAGTGLSARDDALRPDPCEEALAAGWAMREAGTFAAALARFEAAIALDPQRAEARGAYAEMLMELGRPAEAAEAFGAAFALDPSCSLWLTGQAEALSQAGRRGEAIAAWELALRLRPDSPRAHLCLARLLREEGRKDEALDHYRETLHLQPRDAEARLELATLLSELGDLPQAAALLQRLLRDDPEAAAAHFHLGRVLLDMLEVEKAAQSFARYLGLEPQDPRGACALLAEAESRMPTALPRSYVRCLFDQYADRFDANLTGNLNYRGHILVAEALQPLLTEPRDILDIGCGTGLAATTLRPLARRLHGIDLSPRMVEKAAERGLYDHLAVGEVVEALSPLDREWEVIVAADVLAYLGDLAPLLRAAHGALKPGGLFVATVESCEDQDVFLKPTRRYAHNAAYIRRLAESCGLETVSMDAVVARTEKNQPVPSLLFVLRRV